MLYTKILSVLKDKPIMKNTDSLDNLWLSLLTPPFLLGLTTIASVTQGLTELGQMSEEIFRGERLPLLNFPDISLENHSED